MTRIKKSSPKFSCRNTFFAVLLSLLLSTNDAPAAEKNRITVLDLTPGNVSESLARVARNSLELSLYNSGFTLLEREQIEKVTRELKIKQIGLNDTEGALLIGKSLSTDYIIVGGIDRIDKFKIMIRVVSVDGARILFVYSRDFSTESEIESAVQKMSVRMTRDIRNYIKTGMINEKSDRPDLLISSRFRYLVPVNDFAEMVKPGFGFILEGGVDNLFIENLFAGLEAGFYAFAGKVNSSDRCLFFPLLLDLGYRIHPSGTFHVSPVLSGGLNYITLRHGRGEGFSMPDDTRKTTLEPIIRGSVIFGFLVAESCYVQLGIGYSAVLESRGTMGFADMSLGLQKIFQ